MKKLMCMAAIAMVLTVFNACTKDELKTSPDEGIEKTRKSDVYLENDYLAFKNMEAVDSVKKFLQNKSLEEQSSWENQLGLKSAKTFRAQASDKLAGFTTEHQAETYARDLVKEGYFSMRDSSMCYPFYNYSWDCVLNKNGVIKIGSVLYCFQKDAQISIMDGKAKTLNQFLSNPESYDTTLVKVYSFPKLKSTIPTIYGTVSSSRMYSTGGGVRWDLALCYDKVTSQINVPGSFDLITVQTGLHYYLYFHEQKKRTFGWSDDQDIFWHQHLSYNLGGNYDPYQSAYSTNFTNMTPAAYYTQVNSTALANVYLDVKGWLFNGALSPIPSSYPGAAPVINNFSCNGKTNYITTPLNLTIN
ncbi:MAG: hypothetical protein JNK09_15840 [Prolixibacteraceae bacterium]|nr:hypothetical protein [Prolixibacteraceae bacterium]